MSNLAQFDFSEEEEQRITEIAEDVQEQIDADSDEFDVPDFDAIQRKAAEFYDVMMITGEQCVRSTLKYFADDAGVSPEVFRGEAEGGDGGENGSSLAEMNVGSNPWYNGIVAMVIDVTTMEDEDHAVRQFGELDDGESRREFVVWRKNTDGIGLLEEGKVYEFNSVTANDSDRGGVQVALNKRSEFTEVDEEIEPSDTTETITGCITSTAGPSGLIHRHPENNRPISKTDYDGPGEPEPDLQLFLTINVPGENPVRALFNREQTEQMTGLTLDESLEMATDAMDLDVVEEEMMADLFGDYITITGEPRSTYFSVEEFEFVDEAEELDYDQLLLQLRSMEGDN